MFLSNFSVRRPVATVVSIFGLMALGLLALMQLKVNERPDVALPLLVVNIPYPGASPETVERELLNRVEKSFQSVTGVREVRSAANEGGASLQVFFEFGKDLVEGADEVRNALGSVRYKLPTEIREPVIVRIDPSAQPIMQVAVSSSSPTHAVISRLVEDQLADRFRALSGVAQVNVYGALRRAAGVEAADTGPDPAFLAALEDDLNTPAAMAELFGLATALETATGPGRAEAKGRLLASARLMGFLFGDPEAWFQGGVDEALKARIDDLVARRSQARGAKDWAAADQIRDELAALNVEVMDSASGATWRLKERT